MNEYEICLWLFWFVLQACHIFESNQYLATWLPTVVAWIAIDLLYFGCQMLLLLIQAMKSLFPSMQTFTFFLLTEFELFFIICCRSWINLSWCRLSVKKRIWETKIVSSKAKSHGAGMAFSLSHLVIVMPPCSTAFLMSHSGRLNPEDHTAAVKLLMHKQFMSEKLTTEMSPTGRVFKVVYLEDQKIEILYFGVLISPLCEIWTSPVYHSWTCPLLFKLTLPEWETARGSCPVIISHWGVDGCGASAYIAGASVLADYRAQLHMEEEPEMKANCFPDCFHPKH